MQQKMADKQPNEKQNIKAIVLAGGLDFGYCSLASRLPLALWPIAAEPVLGRLLQNLAQQGITEAVVCSYEDTEQLAKSIGTPNGMKLTFLDEPMPMGTAGSIRQAVNAGDISSLLVIHAGIIGSPNIDELLAEYRKSKSDLTIVLCSENDRNELQSGSAGIYLCEPSILEYIPAEGYCDIKETLVPALLEAGRKVSVIRPDSPVENFRDWQGYIHAVAVYLGNAGKTDIDLPVDRSADGKNIWISPDARVDETARIFGPVVIMAGAVVAQNAVILGPTILAADVYIGHGAMVSESVLWDNARIGTNCEVRKCLLDYKTIVPDAAVLENELVSAKRNANLQKTGGKIKKLGTKKSQQLQSFIQPRVNNWDKRLPGWIKSGERDSINFAWLGVCTLIAAFVWSYWTTMADLLEIWLKSDEYSSGLLVPLIAIYIAWLRRKQLTQCRICPSMLGLLLFLSAQGLRFFGLFYMYSSAERLSLVVSLASMVLFLFGWTVFRKSLTMLLFLGLMLPLPKSFEARITLPLQSLATSSAVFSLEMLGYEVAAEGNVIHLGQTTVAVAEACNGLRMVTSFFVISGLVILLVNRAWWEKLILLLSTLPTALFCNTVRLTITSIAFTILKGEYWEKVFHDYGGYAMMPLALAIVVFELWILTKIITVPVDHKQEEILVTRSKQ
jgi:exosortase